MKKMMGLTMLLLLIFTTQVYASDWVIACHSGDYDSDAYALNGTTGAYTSCFITNVGSDQGALGYCENFSYGYGEVAIWSYERDIYVVGSDPSYNEAQRQVRQTAEKLCTSISYI